MMYGLITYDSKTDIELFESTVLSGRIGSITEYDESKRFLVVVAGNSPDVFFENRAHADCYCFGHFRSSLAPTEPVFIVLLDPIHPMAYQAKHDGIYGLTNVDSSLRKLFAADLPATHRKRLDLKAEVELRQHQQQESQKNFLSLAAIVAFFVIIIYLAVK